MKNSASRRVLSLTVPLAMSLIALLFLEAKPVFAQDLDNVTISGRVSDQNGGMITGALIEAVRVKTGATRTTVTDDEGRYRLIQLEPGVYNLRASFSGFAPQEKTGLSFIAGKNVQLDVMLVPQGVTVDAVVVVTATETPAVDTTRTVVGGTVTTIEVESLPVSTRSPLDLVFTLPGVSEEALSTRDLAEDRNATAADTPEEAGTFSLSGSPAYSNNITIDGLDNNDDRAARERFQPSIEAVEEVQIITNQFAAEYGRASGGRINIRTRGGSNSYRGRVFYFFRNDILNANTSNNQAKGLPRLPLEEHVPGFTFSGPVRLPLYDGRERTFFFTAYEYDTVLDSATIDTLVPIQQNSLFPLPSATVTDPALIGDLRFKAGIAPFVSSVSTPLKNHTFTTRIDHKFSDLHNSSVLYQLGRQDNLRQFGGGNRLADALLGKRRGTDAVSYTDNLVSSGTLVNQTRVQFSRLTPSVTAGGGSRKPVVLITLDDPLPSNDPAQRSGTLVAGSSTSGATDRRESRAQLQDVVSSVRDAHSLKFGGDVHYIRSTFI
nr:carboxypeptidase regulatory-like domain-containing protein [Acidobacteriota bacterium]